MKVEISELQQLLKVIEEKGLSVSEVISSIKGESRDNEEFSLTVDYSRTVQEMITVGNYDWIDSGITAEHFPLPTELLGEKTTISVKLFHFGNFVNSQEAITKMNKAGYRPGTLAELLALGETQPELQKQFPIIALGSVWRGADDGRGVPVLGFFDSKRRLSLHWFDDGWSDDWRFFAVRK